MDSYGLCAGCRCTVPLDGAGKLKDHNVMLRGGTGDGAPYGRARDLVPCLGSGDSPASPSERE